LRTDDNNNPAAFTTALAIQADLVKGIDWEDGTPFPEPSTLITARILGDPVQITIRLIDAVGYYTRMGNPRWSYIALPKFVWDTLTPPERRDVIGFHYRHEGGFAMRKLFPNYDIA